MAYPYFSAPPPGSERACGERGSEGVPKLDAFVTVLRMDRNTLRAVQAPLKERYREDPEAALVTLSATITAQGVLDFRGTLGVDRDAPVGFREIALRFDLDAPHADEDQLATLMKLTERYCVVLQTLRSSPALRVDHTSTPL